MQASYMYTYAIPGVLVRACVVLYFSYVYTRVYMQVRFPRMFLCLLCPCHTCVDFVLHMWDMCVTRVDRLSSG